MRRSIPGVLVLWLGVVLGLPGASIEDLIKQARSKDSDERRNAFKDLAEASPEASQVLPTLMDGLKDPDKYVRRFAAQALGKLEDLDGKKVLPTLSKMAGDKNEQKEVQEAVVAAMGKMGTDAVVPLTKVLKDHDKDLSVRQRAADSLGIIGPPGAKTAVPVLLEVMNEKGDMKKKGMPNLEGSIRVDAIAALGKIASKKDDAAVKALETLAAEKNKDKNFKAAVNSALKAIKARD
jgi:HEAT repeat protein